MMPLLAYYTVQNQVFTVGSLPRQREQVNWITVCYSECDYPNRL